MGIRVVYHDAVQEGGISCLVARGAKRHWYHYLLGMLQLVGAVGDYFGERAGLRKVRKRAVRWLGDH